MQISVVIPNFNHGRFLKNNLDALIAQTFCNWNAYVVDDCSSDGSRMIIESYAAKDKRVIPIFLEKNIGALPAHATGLARSSGELLYNSSADDFVCNKNFFKDAVEAINETGAAGFFGKTRIIDGVSESFINEMGHAPQIGHIPAREVLPNFLRKKLFIPGTSSIWRRDLFDQAGGFDPALGPQCDYFLNHALSALGGVVFSSKTYTAMRYFESSYGNDTKNHEFMIRHALVEKKLKNLPIPYSIPEEDYLIWEDLTIAERLNFRSWLALFNHINKSQWHREPETRGHFPSRVSEKMEELEKIERKLLEEVISSYKEFGRNYTLETVKCAMLKNYHDSPESIEPAARVHFPLQWTIRQPRKAVARLTALLRSKRKRSDH